MLRFSLSRAAVPGGASFDNHLHLLSCDRLLSHLSALFILSVAAKVPTLLTRRTIRFISLREVPLVDQPSAGKGPITRGAVTTGQFGVWGKPID